MVPHHELVGVWFLMRYTVSMTEGGDTREGVLSLRHHMAFKDAHEGLTIDKCLGIYGDPVRPWEDWLPWLAWHVLDDSGRSLDEFLLAVDDVSFGSVNEPDPSGGETDDSTSTGSPESATAQTSSGKSSSPSTTSGKKRSGGTSAKK